MTRGSCVAVPWKKKQVLHLFTAGEGRIYNGAIPAAVLILLTTQPSGGLAHSPHSPHSLHSLLYYIYTYCIVSAKYILISANYTQCYASKKNCIILYDIKNTCAKLATLRKIQVAFLYVIYV